MQTVLKTLVILFFSLNAFADQNSSGSLAPNPKWLKKELTRMRLPKSFIKESLEYYEKETFDKILKLNLVGFLQPPAHMDLVTDRSVHETKKFIQLNNTAFRLAEERYEVPGEVVSSLLWIETKHGLHVGKYNVLSVYYHILQADIPANRKRLTQIALEKNRKLGKYTNNKLIKLMAERTKKRTSWAREQIWALAASYRANKLDLKTLKGSFAGAFGLSQFIPSSYKEYAQAARPDLPPDLYNPNDAILSVAHYLRTHGWSNTSSEDQVKSLMKYNQSRDYADSILEISKKVTTAIDQHNALRGVVALDSQRF